MNVVVQIASGQGISYINFYIRNSNFSLSSVQTILVYLVLFDETNYKIVLFIEDYHLYKCIVHYISSRQSSSIIQNYVYTDRYLSRIHRNCFTSTNFFFTLSNSIFTVFFDWVCSNYHSTCGYEILVFSKDHFYQCVNFRFSFPENDDTQNSFF